MLRFRVLPDEDNIGVRAELIVIGLDVKVERNLEGRGHV